MFVKIQDKFFKETFCTSAFKVNSQELFSIDWYTFGKRNMSVTSEALYFDFGFFSVRYLFQISTDRQMGPNNGTAQKIGIRKAKLFKS